MNRILLVCLLAATLGSAQETNLTITVDGIAYTNVQFRGTTPVSVAIFHSTGVATIPLEKLPPELQKRFGYDPQRAGQWQASQAASTPPPAARAPIREPRQTTPAEIVSRFPELGAYGAFGFPQATARVLCNNPALRFSVWSNDQYLFAQAVMWKDNDSSVGKDADDQPLGDYSHLGLDLDGNGKMTPDVDRIYYLNQRPYLPGMRFSIWKSGFVRTGMKDDYEGRAALRYVDAGNGQRVRVDTYLIPLEAISRHVGDKIGLCYYAFSPKPRMSLNSVTDDPYEPRSKYGEYVLTNRGQIDLAKVPDGRDDEVTSKP